MIFDIKLKVGFFKTRGYCLTVGHKQIFLTPHDDDYEKYIINDKELVSIGIYKKNRQIAHLEIVSKRDVYIGSFAIPKNIEEVCQLFIKEFGNKLIFQ
ncbi:hypothetical protein SPSYN_00397 [Sporotomaculum syntrophicum]|uniref:Uncharacterized protein n=1 Tax=Sporotomaculum syntrophicum TaxID=182264 RepID=A0A9D2WSQ8_9FIRM|nr:hypothetical protein [Sporotomaculum syntrophicum]KAF1086678.1 hypothetical protein SPSYN_00397 [Sporotomaculum syntrophicum]